MDKNRWAYIKELSVFPGSFYYGKPDPYISKRRRARRSGEITARQQRKLIKLTRYLRRLVEQEE